MKMIKTEQGEINVPTSWNDINLNTYIKICKLEENKSKYVSDELYIIELVNIILDGKIDIDDLTFSEFDTLTIEFAKILTDRSFETSKEIIIEGVEYKFIDINKIKIGEYISLKTISQDRNIYDALPEILTILIRPINEKYNPDLSNSRIEMFSNKLMVGDFLKGVSFFLTGKEEFITTMKDTLMENQALSG